MGVDTGIEYVDSTTNPAPFCTGCEVLDHCYAKRLSERYAGRAGWPDTFHTPTYFPERLERAMNWSDLTGADRLHKPWLNGLPRVIFVNDIGDGFCPDADPREWLPREAFKRIERTPHIWLLLTKWPWNMLKYLEILDERIPDNLWLGTSITSNDTLHRMRTLAMLKAWTPNIWISAEPLIGPLIAPKVVTVPSWLVAGGESGPAARPMHPLWIRNLRNYARAVNLPFFFKQWGDTPAEGAYDAGFNGDWHRGGMELDGRTWTQVPWKE